MINTPKLSELYTNTFYIPSSITGPTPSTGFMLASDGNGSSRYIPLQYPENFTISTISTYSMVVYGTSTFVCQGAAIFDGPVTFSTLAFNTTDTTNIAIGYQSGYSNQGSNTIAIGYQAGFENQGSNTIVLNALGTQLNTISTNAFYAAPIRSDLTQPSGLRLPMYWDSITKEVTQGPLYIPPPTLSTFSTLTISTVFTSQTVSTLALYVSSINGLPYFLPPLISTFSSVTVSSFITAKSVSTQSLILSSINGFDYIPFQIISTFSSLTVNGPLIGGNTVVNALSANTISTGVVSTDLAYVLAMNTSTISTGSLVSYSGLFSGVSTSILSTGFLYAPSTRAANISTNFVSTGSFVGGSIFQWVKYECDIYKYS